MKRLNRDAVTAMIVIEMLAQGVYFDSRRIRSLPTAQSKIDRAFRGLIKAGVVEKTKTRTKYLLTDEFLDGLRQDITKGMPRGTFIHHPDLTVFEISGIGSWSAEELSAYVERFTQRWMLRKSAL
jgi:hypothetical protein